MNLLDQIPENAIITVDSIPIIYFLDGKNEFAMRYLSFFKAVEEGRNRIVISTITLAEVLSGPFKNNNELLEQQYKKAMSASKGWEIVPLTDEIAVHAARIQASTNLKLANAIQAATVISTGSYGLLTNDRDFSSCKDIRVLY